MLYSLVLLSLPAPPFSFFFFFNDTATTEIYTLSLHDALPICLMHTSHGLIPAYNVQAAVDAEHALIVAQQVTVQAGDNRSEEHTSELQSLAYLVCRLLLEKKKNKGNPQILTAPDSKAFQSARC